MAQQRLSVRKIREVLRLRYEAGLTERQVAAALAVARSTVQECLRRCREGGIGWPPPAALDDVALAARLYPTQPAAPAFPMPDFAKVHAELQRKGVTRRLLWQEYRAVHADGCEYSAFCDHYQIWASRQDAVLRRTHAAGDKLFVDYAGATKEVIDSKTGEVREAQIFVAVLGHPYGPNTERGIYRSVNGGRSFDKVLYKDENTGGNDVDIDPVNPSRP